MGCLWECPPADWAVRVKALGALTLHCSARAVSEQLLADARALGIPVLCYTVNDPLAAEILFQRGVTAVFSDRIDCLGQSGQ